MEILTALADPAQWAAHLEYKVSGGNLSRREEKELRQFIDGQCYLPVVRQISEGVPLPPPRRSAISKMHSEKKRIVYTFPPAENQVLKLMTHLLLRKYDHLFSPCLYSFRPGRSVRDALNRLTQAPEIDSMWSYKVDIRNYFGSVPIERLLPALEQILFNEPELYRFLATLLTDPMADDRGTLIEDTKGIMAGTPISTFFANLYLSELDAHFDADQRLYARYSDDIIVFAETKEQLDRDIAFIRQALEGSGLSVNPDKESVTAPGEKWVFLGFSYQNGIVDIAPASVDKLKAKMRRKTRSLMRWKTRKKATGQRAARAFIKTFNRKLFETTPDHDLTWARWYFPMINTTASLQEVDHYAQECIRYLATGKRSKAAYAFRYEQMKELGYTSLVNCYYSHRWGEKSEETVADF